MKTVSNIWIKYYNEMNKNKDKAEAIAVKTMNPKQYVSRAEKIINEFGNFNSVLELGGGIGGLCKHDPDPYKLIEFWNSEEHKTIIKNIDINKCPRCTFTAYNEIIEDVIIKDKMCRLFP